MQLVEVFGEIREEDLIDSGTHPRELIECLRGQLRGVVTEYNSRTRGVTIRGSMTISDSDAMNHSVLRVRIPSKRGPPLWVLLRTKFDPIFMSREYVEADDVRRKNSQVMAKVDANLLEVCKKKPSYLNPEILLLKEK